MKLNAVASEPHLSRIHCEHTVFKKCIKSESEKKYNIPIQKHDKFRALPPHFVYSTYVWNYNDFRDCVCKSVQKRYDLLRRDLTNDTLTTFLAPLVQKI